MKLVDLVVFIIEKFIKMHGHMNVKYWRMFGKKVNTESIPAVSLVGLILSAYRVQRKLSDVFYRFMYIPPKVISSFHF
jgi:hypothetical protein